MNVRRIVAISAMCAAAAVGGTFTYATLGPVVWACTIPIWFALGVAAMAATPERRS